MSGHTTRQSQRLLRTLFGDYWMAEGALAPAGAVAEMLGDYGVSVPAARAALRRSAQKDLLASSRSGRSTHYGLTGEGRRTLAEVWDRLVEFGTAQEWDGRWTCVAFSIPEQQRDQRHRLRGRLRWLGFAPLYDGVWVCPKAVDGRLRAVLAELGVAAATVIVGEQAGSGTEFGRALDAWDLAEVRAECERFVAETAGIEERMAAGLVAPAEALRLRTRLMVRWVGLVNDVPDLPPELLPADWPVREARRLWETVYDGLRLPARYRVRQIVAAYAPELVDGVAVRAVGDAVDAVDAASAPSS
ncbi:PaaX family transcriptional regulator C-terminal domain-containing protein [Actinomadura sp. WMMB 499]|uniref:PaaX family transcriptional regulator n=1 Tax=Actinomadura sp. WMMB 499 TaxID=1219491 RepID=UPI0012451CA1|nr:PaaX family transcriptional regulator C-terminal domain-containing protein [Actinomadura sp. WMMB 499]QFG21565.1 PaaX family transcriptional regulator [Actinomadura sp. WMMB 499]